MVYFVYFDGEVSTINNLFVTFGLSFMTKILAGGGVTGGNGPTTGDINPL